MDARRRGIDPDTGKLPRTHAIRERLRKFLAEEPGRLEQTFHILIETYENAFGVQAAAAFAKCIRARHAGIPVEIESRRSEKMNTDQLAEKPPAKAATFSARCSPTVLPVPKPLPEAIAAGHFGEQGSVNVKPAPAEVRAITENHAEKIIDLLNGLREVERSLVSSQCGDRARVESEAARLRKEVRAAVYKYVASFGSDAGERLEAYCRRQQKVNAGRGRQRQSFGREILISRGKSSKIWKV